MQIYEHIALANISKLLRYVVYHKSKSIGILYGKPYILKTSIQTKVKILKEKYFKKKYTNTSVVSVQSMEQFCNEYGGNPYLQGKYREDGNFLAEKNKYLAAQEETDYTLRIPSITRRIMDNPNALSASYRPKPERVDVTANELLLHLARKSNKDIMEAAVAVVNSMFNVQFSEGVDLPQDFNFSTQDVQLYEALVNAGAQRHKAGTKALTRAFQNIHSMLSKDVDNLYASVDFETDELNELKKKKFTFEEIVFFFKSYLARAKKKGLPVDRSISRFFYYGFNKPWSPLMTTYLAYKRHLAKKRKKKKSFGKDIRKVKPSRGYNKFPDKKFDEKPVIIPKQDTVTVQVSSSVRRRRKIEPQNTTPLELVTKLLKREMEKIPNIRTENMDDDSYERLAERLCTAAQNYKTNSSFNHIHQGAIGNIFITYVKDRVNSEGFRVQYMFTPTFMERFIGWAFRERLIVLANSGVGYRGQFEYTPNTSRQVRA